MFIPRCYQQEAIDATLHYLNNYRGNPMICLPTGTGKSIVIAKICQALIQVMRSANVGHGRILNLTHVKELVQQNGKKFEKVSYEITVGYFCSGLNKRVITEPITFGSIQSVAKALALFDPFDIIIVDECHLISPKDETQYQLVFSHFKQLNPYLRVIGLTATPYRLGSGNLIDSSIFDDIVYDRTGRDDFIWFIEQGYLSSIRPKRPETFLEVDGVTIRQGDYAKGQLEAAVNVHSKTVSAVKEMCQYGFDRKSWLLFGSGKNHVEAINRELINQGVTSTFVHSGIKKKERDSRLKAYLKGEFRAMVNMGILTTGFDHPPLDLIGVLRPTQSPVLWVQMLGRGTRPWGGGEIEIEPGISASWPSVKKDCLVMDFAGNTARIGPINDPVRPKKRKKGQGAGDGSQAPVRLCPECDHYSHATKPICDYCDYVFPIEEKIDEKADTLELIAIEKPTEERYKVKNVWYRKNQVMGKLPTLRVTYVCDKLPTSNKMQVSGTRKFLEWICLEHFETSGKDGFARREAKEWWYERSPLDPPKTIDEALTKTSSLPIPKFIHVITNQQYPKITRCEY